MVDIISRGSLVIVNLLGKTGRRLVRCVHQSWDQQATCSLCPPVVRPAGDLFVEPTSHGTSRRLIRCAHQTWDQQATCSLRLPVVRLVGDVLGRDAISQPDGHTWCERALVHPPPLETARVVKISQPEGHAWCERALVHPPPLGGRLES